MAGLSDIGISALLGSQSALAATSQNIANVNTEGYTRQRVSFDARPPQAFGSEFIGTGVNVGSIGRVYDAFLTEQIRTNSASFNQIDMFNSLASRVDSLMADSQVSLMTGLQSFFNAVQDVANDPSAASSRQVLLTQGETLTDRFQSLDQRFNEFRDLVNSNVGTVISDINTLAGSLAEVNRSISDNLSQGNATPNELLDKRDQLLKQLSEKVSIDVFLSGDGVADVFVGNGQSIVAGFQSLTLSTVSSEFDATRLEVGYDTSGGASINITSQLSGGELGGLIQFRNEILDNAQDSLGFLATGLAASFNAQHRMGMDQLGALGGDFFQPIDSNSATVAASSANSGSPAAQITASVSSVAALVNSNYMLERNGSSYTLTRMSDNTVTTLSTFPGSAETVDGITLSLSSGTIASGDRFLIQPLRTASGNFNMALTNTAKIAAAAPIRTGTTLSNGGSGVIDPGTITDIGQYVSDNYTLTFTSPTAYQVVGSTTGTVASGTYSAGGTISFNGISVAVSGAPASGDSFTISPNNGGVSDNRNALSLVGLQNSNTLLNGTATFKDVYSQVVVDIATRTRRSEVSRDAQQGLLRESVAARDAKSGVNLDEEAADLLKFQQQYQAATRIISAADSLFQSLLDVLRR